MNVFFLDDDEDDLELFTEAVREIDRTITITTCSNPYVAIEYLDAELPSHIFLDINMPLMNGVEFLQVLRNKERYSNIPVTFLSTSSLGFNGDACKQFNASFVQKPAIFSELINVIKEKIAADKS